MLKIDIYLALFSYVIYLQSELLEDLLSESDQINMKRKEAGNMLKVRTLSKRRYKNLL